jgi:hypothetical protein
MNIKSAIKRIVAGPEKRPVPDLGRNDRCWCGSGKKYKGCHLADDERRRAAMRAAPGRQAPLTRGF